MKTKYLLLNLLIILSFSSCKDVKKEEIVEEKPITFDVNVDITIPKDDTMIVYYKDGSNEWFDEKHSVWVDVKGSAVSQTINFPIPEGILPNNIRIDFSRNPLQEPVKISGIRINYLKSSFIVNENDISKFFDVNEYVKFDNKTGLYTPFKDAKGAYDPFLSINIAYYNEMDKMIKNAIK